MKTMIFWLENKCRTPKMRGLATATCSALTITDYRRMAQKKEGRLFIVDADSAIEGRDTIKRYRNGEQVAGMTLVMDDQRTFAIGANAVLAVNGANHCVEHWDENIRLHGRVPSRETVALGNSAMDNLARLSLKTLFAPTKK